MLSELLNDVGAPRLGQGPKGQPGVGCRALGKKPVPVLPSLCSPVGERALKGRVAKLCSQKETHAVLTHRDWGAWRSREGHGTRPQPPRFFTGMGVLGR